MQTYTVTLPVLLNITAPTSDAAVLLATENLLARLGDLDGSAVSDFAAEVTEWEPDEQEF